MTVTPRFEAHRNRIEEALARVIAESACPALLQEAMGYSLLSGGKRLRPVLLLSARDLLPAEGPDPLPAACALEMIHTYSLVHDDLPAMDDDDLRRGKPSNHKRFGEATAVLVGDALLTEAFAWMARSWCGVSTPNARAALAVIAEIGEAAGAAGMVGGQVLDTTRTGEAQTAGELEETHRRKTGALIRAAVRCGAMLGAADADALDRLTRYGERIGLAFQIADDVLDVVGSRAQLGKSAGKDAAQGKTTYVSLFGLDGARDQARQVVGEALDALTPFDGAAEPLRAIARFIVDRTH